MAQGPLEINSTSCCPPMTIWPVQAGCSKEGQGTGFDWCDWGHRVHSGSSSVVVPAFEVLSLPSPHPALDICGLGIAQSQGRVRARGSPSALGGSVCLLSLLVVGSLGDPSAFPLSFPLGWASSRMGCGEGYAYLFTQLGARVDTLPCPGLPVVPCMLSGFHMRSAEGGRKGWR